MGCRVLILEDDVNLRSVYTVMLNGMGHSVTPVGAAEDVLPGFERDAYDCLLVNHKLPKMMGIDFVKRVREIDDRVGIVLTTASDPAEVDKLCEGLGIWAVVPKTAPMKLIEEKIHEACELSHMSPAKEAAFIESFESETRQLRVLNKDLLNETGIWPADQLHEV